MSQARNVLNNWVMRGSVPLTSVKTNLSWKRTTNPRHHHDGMPIPLRKADAAPTEAKSNISSKNDVEEFNWKIPRTTKTAININYPSLETGDVPFSLACLSRSICAWPESTPGCTDGGKLGNDSKAHSSTHGKPKSAELPPFCILFMEVDLGRKPPTAEKDTTECCAIIRAMAIKTFIVLLYYLQDRWI